MAASGGKSAAIELEVGDRMVRISNPDRVYFSARGETKLDLARYYLSVGDGIVRALRERPCMLHRFPDGVDGEKVHQKRLPARRAAVGRDGARALPALQPHADELCVTELGSVIWAVQMSTVEFHPWNSRRADTEKPDEWRIDLDPMPDCDFDTRPAGRRTSPTRCSTSSARSAGRRPRAARACTSTCGSSRRWGFADVRRAALAFAREVERRAPDDVTTTWWRKDRDPAKLFVDYNQNARDHTIAARTRCAACPKGRCRRRSAGTRSTTSCPRDFTIATVPARFAELGDLHAGIDDAVFSLETLLEWAERDERDGAADPGGPAEDSSATE